MLTEKFFRVFPSIYSVLNAEKHCVRVRQPCGFVSACVSLFCVVICVWCEAGGVTSSVSSVTHHGHGALHAWEVASLGPGVGSWKASKPPGVSLPSHPLSPPPHRAEERTSPFLREVQVNLIDFKKCNDYLVYDSYLTPRMMCAGDLRGGRDSCQVGLLLRGAQSWDPEGREECWGAVVGGRVGGPLFPAQGPPFPPC